MFIKSFPVGPFQCNCTIIGDPKSGEAMVIDPGDDAETILNEVKAQGFDVKYLLHTHAHIDHIAATKEVHAGCGGEICLHKGDIPLYENLKMQAEFLGVDLPDGDVLPISKFMEHGDIIECNANLRSEALFTPGHTPGSMCFLLKGMPMGDKEVPLLLSGDTLFSGSIGRTDLWGGDHPQIIASIKEKLLTLPPETIVIPGHGPQTSIGHEVQSNPFVS